jgi:hypothetical protein
MGAAAAPHGSSRKVQKNVPADAADKPVGLPEISPKQVDTEVGAAHDRIARLLLSGSAASRTMSASFPAVSVPTLPSGLAQRAPATVTNSSMSRQVTSGGRFCSPRRRAAASGAAA